MHLRWIQTQWRIYVDVVLESVATACVASVLVADGGNGLVRRHDYQRTWQYFLWAAYTRPLTGASSIWLDPKVTVWEQSGAPSGMIQLRALL